MQDPLDHLTIRDTVTDDIVSLRTMHARAWRDTYPSDKHGVSREWVKERTDAWLTPEGIEETKVRSKEVYGHPDHLHKVAVLPDGTVVGMIHLARKEGGYRLNALYVDKQYYGTGVAQRLMEAALAWSDPTLPIDLQIVIYNERAKAFYHKRIRRETGHGSGVRRCHTGNYDGTERRRKMKLEGKPFENSAFCRGVGYAEGGASMDIAKIELTGRYPERGWIMNEVSYELAYVLQGNGDFIRDGQDTLRISGGDVVSIPVGKKYAWYGNLTIVVACSPPFDPAQHKFLEEAR